MAHTSKDIVRRGRWSFDSEGAKLCVEAVSMQSLLAGSFAALVLAVASPSHADVEHRRTTAIVITSIGVTLGTILTAQRESRRDGLAGFSGPLVYASQIAIAPSVPRFVVGSPGAIAGGAIFSALRVVSLLAAEGARRDDVKGPASQPANFNMCAFVFPIALAIADLITVPEGDAARARKTGAQLLPTVGRGDVRMTLVIVW